MYFSLKQALAPWRTASPLFDPYTPGLCTTYFDVEVLFGALEPSRADTDAGAGRERSPAAAYTTVPAAHGTARAALVGGGGTDGGE